MKEEWTLSDVEGAFLIGPDAPGAYIVVANGRLGKIIHEIQVGATITTREFARLGTKTDSPIVALHLNAEAQYGICIAANGYIEIFEFHASQTDWEKRIGPADREYPDTMEYARTSEFYKVPENRI